jgi:hypothetical protein
MLKPREHPRRLVSRCRVQEQVDLLAGYCYQKIFVLRQGFRSRIGIAHYLTGVPWC